MIPEQSRSDLGTLADPQKHTEPLDLSGHDAAALKNHLRMMLLIRTAEEGIASLVDQKLAHTPCHLAIGQEAVATGVSFALRKTDRVFGAHRSHSHYLALGGSLQALIAEVLGKADGCSNGMGGSMHLHAPGVGFLGSVPIVAATVPLAVGAGMAAKMDGNGDLAVAYFGDGSSEEGAIHEALNLASNYKLPVLFVCENNLYSSHMDIQLRQPSDRIARFADAHCMFARVIDGNDVLKVADTTADLCNMIRAGEGPAFLEAVTYRWRGHVGPDENIDVGVRRKEEDLIAWKRRDPIARLAVAMLNDNVLTESDYSGLRTSVEEEFASADKFAKSAPYPESRALLDFVYASRS